MKKISIYDIGYPDEVVAATSKGYYLTDYHDGGLKPGDEVEIYASNTLLAISKVIAVRNQFFRYPEISSKRRDEFYDIDETERGMKNWVKFNGPLPMKTKEL
jgi:hypothetical protein